MGAIAAACNNPEHVVHTHVPLSPSSVIWYRPNGSDLYGWDSGKVTVGQVWRRTGRASYSCYPYTGSVAYDREIALRLRLVWTTAPLPVDPGLDTG